MKAAAALLAFLAVATATAAALGFAFSGVHPSTAVPAMILGALAAASAWRGTQDIRSPRPGIWDWMMLGIFALASLRAFLWLIYEQGDELRVLSPNNLGDMALHLNFIRYLASGIPFWPESPILSHTPLTYPLGMDLFNALPETCGINTIRGLVWTGLTGAALTGFLLWRWGGAFGLAALLFNGGLAGFAVFHTLEIKDFQTDLAWKNLFLSMFVTQRGLLFALPAGLLLLTAWREQWFRSGKRILPLWLQTTLYALLPLFNAHAFLFLSLMLAAMFLAKPEARKPLLQLIASSLAPATLCVLFVTGFFSATGGIHPAPGWLWKNPADASLSPSALQSLAWNFGLALLLVPILGLALIRKGNVEARCFAWTSLLVLALCTFIAFAPWPWDNMKLILWAWLVIAPYLWKEVLRPLPGPVPAILCAGLFFSGTLSLFGGLDTRHGYTLAQRSELDAWREALHGIPTGERIACVPDYNHPVILLGRKVVCGYEGHLWSHGLPYHQTLETMQGAFKKQIPWDIAAEKIGADWLAIRGSTYYEILPPGQPPELPELGALYYLRDPDSPASEDKAPRRPVTLPVPEGTYYKSGTEFDQLLNRF